MVLWVQNAALCLKLCSRPARSYKNGWGDPMLLQSKSARPRRSSQSHSVPRDRCLCRVREAWPGRVRTGVLRVVDCTADTEVREGATLSLPMASQGCQGVQEVLPAGSLRGGHDSVLTGPRRPRRPGTPLVVDGVVLAHRGHRSLSAALLVGSGRHCPAPSRPRPWSEPGRVGHHQRLSVTGRITAGLKERTTECCAVVFSGGRQGGR